jgi:hypothetical protein
VPEEKTVTFAYDDPQDSVTVEAHLSKESTLAVISGVPSPVKP